MTHKVLQANQTVTDILLLIVNTATFTVVLWLLITGNNTKQQIYTNIFITNCNNYYNELLNKHYNGIYLLLMTFSIFFLVTYKYLSIK